MNPTPKVLFLSSGTSIGGTERMVLTLSREFSARQPQRHADRLLRRREDFILALYQTARIGTRLDVPYADVAWNGPK